VVLSHGPGTRPQWAERTLARPLFSQSRRPSANISVVTAGLPKLMPQRTGVVVSPAGSFAILASMEATSRPSLGRVIKLALLPLRLPLLDR
jgi:hypothetical protein